jgi:hypothetical protein
MSHAETGMRAAGFWLALAAFLLAAALAFHGPLSPSQRCSPVAFDLQTVTFEPLRHRIGRCVIECPSVNG